MNVIPQSRRWCVLHQAVYWNNEEILRTLLKFKTCDSEIRAKKCLSECGPTDRLSALEIAKSYMHTKMSLILEQTMLNSVLEQEIPTYVPYYSYNEDQCQSLILITLSSYKQAFHPRPVDPLSSTSILLRDIFYEIDESADRWKDVRTVVVDSVYTVNEDKANALSRCETKEEFYGQVVNCYTDENNAIYRFLNMAFRRQRGTGYRPTGEDLAVGPYCVMYQMLLLFWTDLRPETVTTHRKMMLRHEDAAKYKIGTSFVWQSVVSSAVFMEHTHAFPTSGPTGRVTVMFTIDNSSPSIWRPRNIESHAVYEETERTYPAGARFCVTNRIDDGEDNARIWLKLLQK